MLNTFASLKCSKKCQHNVQKPTWEEKKLGWIPSPTTERANFMNAVLPKCYKAFYANYKNACEFVKL